MKSKYKILLLLGLIFSLTLSGCGAKDEEGDRSSLPILAIEVVTELVEQDIGFDTSDMHSVNMDYMETLFDISESDIIDFVIKLPTGTNLNEYGVFIAKEDKIKAVSKAVEDYLTDRKEAWDDRYLAEEKFKIDRGESDVLGQYVFYSIGGDFDKLSQAILKFDEKDISEFEKVENNEEIHKEEDLELAESNEENEDDLSPEGQELEEIEDLEEKELSEETQALDTREKSDENKSKELVEESNESFVSTSTVNYNDGLDLSVLDMIYLGQYKHLAGMDAYFSSSTTSSWTQPAIEYENEKQAILWRKVGSQSSGTVTLLSEYVLDSRSFHSSPDWLSWDYSKSNIRKWLNSTFLDSFTASEKDQLVSRNIVQNMWNPDTSSWVNGSFTSLWGSGAEHTDSFPKTAEGDKVYLPWRQWNSNNFYWDSNNVNSNENMIKGEAAKVKLRNGKTSCKTGDSIWMLSRSPSPESANHILPLNYTTSKFGIRPIINLQTKNIFHLTADGHLALATGVNAIKEFKINGKDVIDGGSFRISSKESLQARVLQDKGLIGYKLVKDNTIVAYETFEGDTFSINTLAKGEYKAYVFVEIAKTGYSSEVSNMITFTILVD